MRRRSIGQISRTALPLRPSEIAYGDRIRHTYATFSERVSPRLGTLDTWRQTKDWYEDWDSHRYLECFSPCR
jgi:hypothetical protein